MSVDDGLSHHLLALEERLLDPVVRRDAEALDLLLVDEFREFGSSGRAYTKREIVGLLAIEAPRSVAIAGFACRRLAHGTALVTYRSRSEAGEALRSSVWVERGGCWRMLFHQGTTMRPAEGPDASSDSFRE